MKFRHYILAITLLCAALAMAQRNPATQAQANSAVRKAVSAPASVPSVGVTGNTAQALDALFIRSDLEAARVAAKSVLTAAPESQTQSLLDPLFVEMEAASLQADIAAELDAAMRLCELAATSSDPRAEIAAARILDSAANTTDFRAIAPRIQTLLARGTSQSSYLRAALLTAASDGMTGESVLALARESGLLTDWAIVGPFGQYPNVAFEKAWPPEFDQLHNARYGDRQSERFQFPTGTVALPNYFGTNGVFYAAADTSVPSSGNWLFRVESAGTLELFIDNVRVLTKDDRFRATPEIVSRTLKLAAGPHRVTIKFLATAAPFRIALLPSPRPGISAEPQIAFAPEAAYIRSALAFWSGDYGSAIQRLSDLRRIHDSALVDFLLAESWKRSGDSSSERVSPLRDALKLAPSAFAAETELAESANDEDRPEDAFERVHRVLQARPSYEPALRLAATTAARLEWPAEASSAFGTAAALHPSCSILKQALEFFASISDYSRVERLRVQLKDCAPNSTAWIESLSDAGRHAEAAAAALSLTNSAPLDRDALALLVREASLAGHSAQAHTAAQQLTSLAPNSTRFRRMAQQVAANSILAQPDSAFVADFASDSEFYTPFRRDGIAVAHQAANRVFSGGPGLVLLNDRVARIAPDGQISVYIHTVTRVLDRDGILDYGEVSIPRGADLLELRTIRPDFTIAEPEFSQHKDTISMPALVPGAVIDLEYVLRYDEGGLADHTDAFHFTFGSFSAPILLSRFLVISPDDAGLQFAPSGGVPTIRVQTNGSQVTRIWERNEIPQSTSEVAMPPTGLLPEVRVLPASPNGWADVRDFYRNSVISAVRAASRVQSFSREVQGDTPEQKLRHAYRLVSSRIRSSQASFDSGEFPGAEETLAAYSGSRSAVLLAFAQTVGIRADLVMTREAGSRPPDAFTPQAYSNPVLVFHLGTPESPRDIALDPEHDGVGFGALSASVERDDALVVPLQPTPDGTKVLASLPATLLDDESVADGDITFDENGDLAASVKIRMGAARSAQMRAVLAGIEPQGRRHFFEQLALRIFRGATEATGDVRHEFDPDLPLEISFQCRAPHFVAFGSSTSDLDQLVPALGLRKMYGISVSRMLPLYLDTPLFEAARFRLRLPSSMRFVGIGEDMVEKNEFGSYSVTFQQESATSVTVRREFHIPVQVIDPARFSAFDRFMRDTDTAERQRLTIEKLPRASSLRKR